MEWFFVLVVLVILVGPIVWALSNGRRSGVPDHEDAQGSTAYGEFIRDSDGTPGGPRY